MRCLTNENYLEVVMSKGNAEFPAALLSDNGVFSAIGNWVEGAKDGRVLLTGPV